MGVPSGGAQLLLNTVEEFSNWSGMEVKIVKSCGMWVGAVFFQSPDGDWYNWEDMVRRVLEETRKNL